MSHVHTRLHVLTEIGTRVSHLKGAPASDVLLEVLVGLFREDWIKLTSRTPPPFPKSWAMNHFVGLIHESFELFASSCNLGNS